MLKSKRFWVIAGVVLLLLAAGAFVLTRGLAVQRTFAGDAPFRMAEVTSITALATVEASGPAEARQTSLLAWGTTGKIATLHVRVGDHVKAGDVLLTLDPTSAPQNIILAQADLIAAEKALDQLLHPSELTIANAQKAVADAQDALTKAQKDLRNVENPAGESLHDAVSDAKLALETAQANLQLSQVSSDVNAYQNAVFLTNWYQQYYEDLKARLDANPGNEQLKDRVEQAYNTYQARLNDQLTLQLRIETDQANKANAVTKAQEKYGTALANLDSALKGPDANKLAVAQTKVAVAQAALAEAQSKLDQLSHPDPDDLAAAQARLQAAQASVSALTVKAPFDGEVLVVNYQLGDSVSASKTAVVLANRSQMHVNVSVDESDIGAIKAGNAVTVTFDSVPDLTLSGRVAQINPVGETVQGLVKFTVRVDLASTDARVLLGMTANVTIVTAVQPGALAVPLDAVQLDDQGEFVNRFIGRGPDALSGEAATPAGGGVPFFRILGNPVRAARQNAANGNAAATPSGFERVPIVSGAVQGDLVVVTGDLQPGDRVQIVEPQPTNNAAPFGPG